MNSRTRSGAMPRGFVVRWSGTFVAVLLAVAVTARPAAAQFTWNNPAGGNWNLAGNLLGGVPVPGATTTLTFGSAATQAAAYTSTNDIGGAGRGTPFDLNSFTFYQTIGNATNAGNPL